MKKKEVLVIVFFSLLTTMAGWLVEWRSITCGVVKCIGINTFCHGFPLTFAINYQLSPRCNFYNVGTCTKCPEVSGSVQWFLPALIIDFLFWFVILLAGWQIVKLARDRLRK
jgi:hypothetical protein